MWSRRALLAAGAALVAAYALPARRSLAASDQLRIGLAHEPPQLDPTAGDDPATLAISYQNIFEGLTRIDGQGAVQPGLARSWSVSADGLDYSFALQPDVRFHDGTSLAADDVVFALERLRSAQSRSPNRARFAAIASVAAADAATVRVRLRQADDRLLYSLGLPDAGIVAPESADNNASVPIGTGPFAFVTWDAGDRVVLDRNEDYWGPHPRINEVTFVFVADPAAAIAALRAGDLDGYPDFPAPEALGPARADPGLRVLEGRGPGGRPRTGVWNAGLGGVRPDAPAGGCVLADLRWADDTGTPEAPPAPAPDDD